MRVEFDGTQYRYMKGEKTMFTTDVWTVKPNREFKEYNKKYFEVMFDDNKETPDCYEWCEKCPCSDMCERYGWEYSCGIWEDCMGEDL